MHRAYLHPPLLAAGRARTLRPAHALAPMSVRELLLFGADDQFEAGCLEIVGAQSLTKDRLSVLWESREIVVVEATDPYSPTPCRSA